MLSATTSWLLTWAALSTLGWPAQASPDTTLAIPLLPFDPFPGYQPGVAICSIIRNQHIDLCEWLYYHQYILNITRIYFWDHASDPPQHDIVAKCSKPGAVVYRYVDHVPVGHSHYHGQPQLWAYNRCLQEFGALHEFMAFIDADEFIVLTGEEKNLTAFMRQIQPFGCLALNWRMFGSSGHVKRPAGGVMETYFKCTNGRAQGRHTKCIVNPQHTLDAWNPHAFNFKPPYYCVNERLEKIHIPYSEYFSAAKIGLNHYVIKSQEDWEAKRVRGSAMGQRKKENYFHLTDTASRYDCNDSLALGRQVMEQVVQIQRELTLESSGDSAFWAVVKAKHHAMLFPPQQP